MQETNNKLILTEQMIGDAIDKKEEAEHAEAMKKVHKDIIFVYLSNIIANIILWSVVACSILAITLEVMNKLMIK